MSIVQIVREIINIFKSKKNNKKNDIIHKIETRVKELECSVQRNYDKDIHDKELVQNEIKASREINEYKLSNLQNSQQQNFELASRNFKILSELMAELRIISRSLPNPN